MKDYDLSLILIPRTLLIDKYTYLAACSLLCIFKRLFHRQMRLPNNTDALIINMYSRYAQEYNAGVNQVQYLTVLSLSGEVLPHCEGQSNLLT